MGKKTAIVSIVLLAVMIAGGILVLKYDNPSIQDNLSELKDISPDKAIRPGQEKAPLQKRPVRESESALKPVAAKTPGKMGADGLKTLEQPAEPAPVVHPEYIEEIKEQIYAREIESVEQIELLDELVQTGDKDTRAFWGDGWTSVDDWKENNNGFVLEKKDDGTLVFDPDSETAKTYTFFENPQTYKYDEENREFVNEVDYYGKTIYNVAKFINNDVLVMMTISGRKVDLNIYQKNAGQIAN